MTVIRGERAVSLLDFKGGRRPPSRGVGRESRWGPALAKGLPGAGLGQEVGSDGLEAWRVLGNLSGLSGPIAVLICCISLKMCAYVPH